MKKCTVNIYSVISGRTEVDSESHDLNILLDYSYLQGFSFCWLF